MPKWSVRQPGEQIDSGSLRVLQGGSARSHLRRGWRGQFWRSIWATFLVGLLLCKLWFWYGFYVLDGFGVVIDKSDSTSTVKSWPWKAFESSCHGQALRWKVGTIIMCIIYTDWSQVAGPQRMAIELQHWQKTVVAIVLGCADDQTRRTRSEFHDPRPAKTRSNGKFREKTLLPTARPLARSRGWTRDCGWICSEVRKSYTD